MSRYGGTLTEEAIYDTTHNHIDPVTGEKGVAALARRIGRNPTTLTKKVDPFVDTHQINIKELLLVMRATKDYSPMEALATECGYGAHVLPKTEVSEQKKGILDCVLNAAFKGGEACQAISESLEDGKITAKEAMECSAGINDQIKALIGLRQQLLDAVIDPEHLGNVTKIKSD